MIPIPAARAFLFLGLATLLLAAAVVAPALVWVALLLNSVTLAAVAWDGRQAGKAALRARRHLPVLLSQGARAELTVELENRSERPLTVLLRDGLHPALAPAPARAALRLAPGKVERWRFSIAPRRRGSHLWGSMDARILGPLGFAWGQRRLLAPCEARVFPQVRWGGRVGNLLALARRRELGLSPTPRQAEGSEPYALRGYLPGDPPNRIHWRATARHGRLITREETWEQGAQLLILLDCGRAMSAIGEERSKLDHALATALALLRLAVGRGDRVGLLAFSDRVERRVAIGHGSVAAVRRAYGALYDLEARRVEPDFDLAVEQALAFSPRRGTSVLCTSVSDLATAERLQQAVLRLSRRSRALLVNLEDPQVASFAYGTPETIEQAYAKVAAMEILLANRRLGRRLRLAGVTTVTTPADLLTVETLDAYLALFQPPGRRTVRRVDLSA
jgi:uncharacterized protein (DUF58 family)